MYVLEIALRSGYAYQIYVHGHNIDAEALKNPLSKCTRTGL